MLFPGDRAAADNPNFQFPHKPSSLLRPIPWQANRHQPAWRRPSCSRRLSTPAPLDTLFFFLIGCGKISDDTADHAARFLRQRYPPDSLPDRSGTPRRRSRQSTACPPCPSPGAPPVTTAFWPVKSNRLRLSFTPIPPSVQNRAIQRSCGAWPCPLQAVPPANPGRIRTPCHRRFQ